MQATSSPLDQLSWVDWSHLRCELLWVYDAVVEPQFLVLKEFAPGNSAFLIRKGSVTVSKGRQEITARAGEWLFLSEGLRAQYFEPNSEILSIRYHHAWPGRLPLFSFFALALQSRDYPELEAAAMPLCAGGEALFTKAHLVSQEVYLNMGNYLDIHTLFLKWLKLSIEIFLKEGHTPARFEIKDTRLLRAIRILDEHPLHIPFKETDLAKEVSLSTSQLSKLFTKEFGVSPCRYYDKRRFEEALARIRATSASLKSIAIDLGFSSAPHFTLWFRRRARVAPSDLRA